MSEVRWNRLATVVLMGALVLPGAAPAGAQEPVDLEVVTRIREEGFQRSQVMDLLSYMTDVLGPRLTGSPNMRRAQRWAKATLDSMGFTNSVIEPFGEAGVGWANTYTSLHLMAPDYQPLIGYPFAFTPGTNGKVAGPATLAVIRSRGDFDKFRGKLRGAIVLVAPPASVPLGETADAERFSDAALERMAAATSGARFWSDGRAYEWNDQAKSFLPVGSSGGGGSFAVEMLRFLKGEGVGVVLFPGPGRDGTVFVAGRPGSREDRSYAGVMSSPPLVALAAEHYNRIYRILDRGVPARLEVEVRNTIDTSDTKGYNVLADWPGTDLADQLVMVGGHYDSWHAGTGATDDAAGVAVAIEAIRILKAIGVKPRRTIRVGLWSYEEGGKVGSRAYVANHFGNERNPKPLHAKLAAYFNLDNGGGRVRGVYLQGNEFVRPIFAAWMAPFADLGMKTLTIDDAYGVDVVGFDLAGLPGFQFIQDPLDYDTRTHHSNMDVYDKLRPDDLRRNAVIMASFLYHAAMRDQPLPRERWPVGR
ncbi:MAG: M20/M25/M40 family metallo-hydrolase [Gemmatimonadales bacterium]